MAGSRGSKVQVPYESYRLESGHQEHVTLRQGVLTDIIVGSMARAEPSSIVTALADGYASQMSTDTEHHQPLRLLNSCIVRLRVSKRLDIDIPCFFDFTLGTVTDEHRFTAPLDDDVLALGDRVEVDLDLGHGQDVGGGAHVDEELCETRAKQR